MAKTIEQLADQANIIQTAVRQGENTAERVGGLFTDIVDYLSNYKASEVKLGPLLTSLNDPRLVNPGDGQTLSFSILKDGWTFDDALTELRISDRKIEETVTSNYRLFLETKDEFAEDMRDITDDLNAKYADFSSYRVQTDQYIDQWCVAYDEDGNKVAVSRIYQTSEEIQSMVTDNKEAADIAFTKLFTLTGLDYDDPSQAYSASWLWQKKDGIYGAAASFDANGNILQSSQLQVTIGGIQTQVTNNKTAADQAFATLNNTVIPGITGRLDSVELESGNSASWIDQNKNKISVVVANFDNNGNPTAASGLVTTSTYSGLFTTYMNENGVVTSGNISTYLTDYVDANGVRQIISVANINADQIKFNMTFDWEVKSGDKTVFYLDNNGNLTVAGNINGGTLTDNLIMGTQGAKMEIFVDEALGFSKNSGIRGINSNGVELLRLGFQEYSSKVRAFLRFGGSYYMEDGLTVSDNNGIFTVGIREGKAYLSAMHWPTEGVDNIGDLPPGTVYLREDSCLGVRR